MPRLEKKLALESGNVSTATSSTVVNTLIIDERESS
jgi:hypothetical protein